MVSAGFSRRVALPCREAGERALQLLLADLRLAARLQALCVHACEALLAQVAASYFVPFCLTAAAVAARVRVLSGAAMMAIVRAYNTAVPLFAVFPARRLDVAAAIDVAETVRVTWRHGVPSVALAPFASGAAGWKSTAERLAAQYGVTQSAGIGASGVTRGAYPRAACMCTVRIYTCSRIGCVTQQAVIAVTTGALHRSRCDSETVLAELGRLYSPHKRINATQVKVSLSQT